jgi:hypothetical protein
MTVSSPLTKQGIIVVSVFLGLVVVGVGIGLTTSVRRVSGPGIATTFLGGKSLSETPVPTAILTNPSSSPGLKTKKTNPPDDPLKLAAEVAAIQIATIDGEITEIASIGATLSQ